MDEKELYRVFERQRRNLILMSVLLFSIIVTGTTIKEINFVFTRLNNPNHEYLLLILWVIFCYFHARYNQYLNTINTSKMDAEKLKLFQNMIVKKIGEKSEALTVNDLYKTKHDDPDDKHEPDYDEVVNGLDKFAHNNKIKGYDSIEKTQMLSENRPINKNIQTFTIKLAIVGHKSDGATQVLREELISETIDYRKFKKERLYAWLKVSTFSFEYFEYYIPNVIAIIVYYKAVPELLKILH